jgi:hypothetical protein
LVEVIGHIDFVGTQMRRHDAGAEQPAKDRQQ